MEVLRAVREETGTAAADRHSRAVAGGTVGAVVDILQIPAFLCRQTDLIAAAARTGKAVGVKEGAVSLARGDEEHPRQGRGSGQRQDVHHRARKLVRLSEPGGRHARLSDRARPRLAGGLRHHALDAEARAAKGNRPAARRSFARPLARAAAAAGADGFFMEVHENPPAAALSDRTTQIRPDAARAIIEDVLKIKATLEPI